MARARNKKVVKLRKYRDKLLASVTNLEGTIRRYEELCRTARRAIQHEDYLRAYALVCDVDDDEHLSFEFLEKNELAKELTLVYKMLAVERNYTDELHMAVNSRDLLRAAALCADHRAEWMAHDKMLTQWSQDHGFTRRFRDEKNKIIV